MFWGQRWGKQIDVIGLDCYCEKYEPRVGGNTGDSVEPTQHSGPRRRDARAEGGGRWAAIS